MIVSVMSELLAVAAAAGSTVAMLVGVVAVLILSAGREV